MAMCMAVGFLRMPKRRRPHSLLLLGATILLSAMQRRIRWKQRQRFRTVDSGRVKLTRSPSGSDMRIRKRLERAHWTGPCHCQYCLHYWLGTSHGTCDTMGQPGMSRADKMDRQRRRRNLSVSATAPCQHTVHVGSENDVRCSIGNVWRSLFARLFLIEVLAWSQTGFVSSDGWVLDHATTGIPPHPGPAVKRPLPLPERKQDTDSKSRATLRSCFQCSHCRSNLQLRTFRQHIIDYWDYDLARWKETRYFMPREPDDSSASEWPSPDLRS